MSPRLTAIASSAAAALMTAVAAHACHRTRRLRAALTRALTDPVTGLPVRQVAEQHLADVRQPVSVALIDVDDLHGFNSAHTHTGGDLYLAAVAARLRQASTPGDVVARLGGDEFVLVSSRPPDEVSDGLAAALKDRTRIGATLFPIRVSIGVARTDPHIALSCADLAMYTAKRRGGGIEHYDPVRDGHPLPAGSRPAHRRRDRASAAQPRT